MTYKDHGKVAEIFRAHLEDADDITLPITDEDCHPYDALTALVDDLAAYMQKDNPRFNRDKFYIGCGIGIV